MNNKLKKLMEQSVNIFNNHYEHYHKRNPNLTREEFVALISSLGGMLLETSWSPEEIQEMKECQILAKFTFLIKNEHLN